MAKDAANWPDEEAAAAEPPEETQRSKPAEVFSCRETLVAADGSEKKTSARWQSLQGDWAADSAGRIVGWADGNGYVYRLQEHADDLRVTTTIRAVEGSEISIWICGSPENTERDGYTLAVSTGGAKLQRKAQDVIDLDSPRIQWNTEHVLSFERRGAKLRGFLDGQAKPFIEWTDPEPLRGKGHRTMGFYVWNGHITASQIRLAE